MKKGFCTITKVLSLSHCLSLGLVLLGGMSAKAQEVNLRGTISNRSGNPVSGAIVTLLEMDLKDTTGPDGTYSIEKTSPTTPTILVPPATVGSISLTGGVLEFTLTRPSSVTIQVFDIEGNLLKSERKEAEAAGTYRWKIASDYLGNKHIIIRASADGRVFLTRDLLGDSDAKKGSFRGSVLARAVAAVDSLEVKAAGFGTKVVQLNSLDEVVNVSLDVADKWGGLRNPPVKSSGCGKPQGITTGKKTIRSANQNRTYIIDIPSNYNPNTPHLLLYISHWINGTSEEMQRYDYYRIKPLANAANKPVIFVAPQSDGGTWQQKDHALFDDIVAHVEDNLCIDTTRIFATGFSFGGMITYSLSTNHQHKIRAAVGMGPANYNIWLPNPKLKVSIPWMQTTGMGDQTTPWVNNDAQRRGAKYIALEKAVDNGCIIPADIPVWRNGAHVCYDFEGCDEGYPVKVCTFNGGHTEINRDPGSNVNWVPGKVWDFFMQF